MEKLGSPSPYGFRCPWVPGPDIMKETPLSNCERRFLLRAIEEKKVNGPGELRLLGSPGPRQSSGWDTDLVLAGPRSPWGTAGASLVHQALFGYRGFFARAPNFYFPGAEAEDRASLRVLRPGPGLRIAAQYLLRE